MHASVMWDDVYRLVANFNQSNVDRFEAALTVIPDVDEYKVSVFSIVDEIQYFIDFESIEDLKFQLDEMQNDYELFCRKVELEDIFIGDEDCE